MANIDAKCLGCVMWYASSCYAKKEPESCGIYYKPKDLKPPSPTPEKSDPNKDVGS